MNTEDANLNNSEFKNFFEIEVSEEVQKLANLEIKRAERAAKVIRKKNIIEIFSKKNEDFNTFLESREKKQLFIDKFIKNSRWIIVYKINNNLSTIQIVDGEEIKYTNDQKVNDSTIIDNIPIERQEILIDINQNSPYNSQYIQEYILNSTIDNYIDIYDSTQKYIIFVKIEQTSTSIQKTYNMINTFYKIVKEPKQLSQDEQDYNDNMEKLFLLKSPQTAGKSSKADYKSTGEKIKFVVDGKQVSRVVHVNKRGTKYVSYDKKWMRVSNLKKLN